MEYTTLGGTGMRISSIGFGGMPLSIEGRPAEAIGESVIRAALEEGINLLDTADVYCLDDQDIGHNEKLFASALRGHVNRDSIVVATKGGMRRPKGEWTRDGSPRHLRQACERSLRALEVDQIDLYQLHAPDPNVPFERSVETLAELQREGKIRHAGLSNVSVNQIRLASSIVEIVSVQNRMNPYFREAIHEGVTEECQSRGITLLAYSPVGGKRLARKLHEFPVLKSLAKRRGTSVHSIVLAWVRSKGKTVVPIPGASSIEHVRDSARSADITLTASEIGDIDRAEFSRA